VGNRLPIGSRERPHDPRTGLRRCGHRRTRGHSAARAEGITTIEPRQGDARRLPYDDATFDAAFLVAVLGEIPDQDAALRELRRVLKTSGRLVVGELFGDPHMVTERTLRVRAARAGLRFERRVGWPFAYFGVLTADSTGCIR
jgi:SAM-dependent methyltransferase